MKPIKIDSDDYDLEISEPYLTKDAVGNYVILQDETLTKQGNGWPIDQVLMHSSEILIDDSPSDAEIFKMKLKGVYRKKWLF